jgi:hypothetical protein
VVFKNNVKPTLSSNTALVFKQKYRIRYQNGNTGVVFSINTATTGIHQEYHPGIP